MIDAIIAWDMEDDPKGNVQHIAANGITTSVAEMVSLTNGTSRGSFSNPPMVRSRSAGETSLLFVNGRNN